MKKVRTLGTKRWVCAILVCALLLTTPSLALAASAPEQTAAQPLTLESIPAELAQTLELDELSPLAELNDADEERLNSLTISNGDGTSTAYIFQGPIKYLDKETNSIQFIDNKLKASDKSSGFLEKYAYENTANDIKVYLPKKIKKGVDMEYENISINMRPEIINNEKGVLKEYAFAGETMEVMEYPDAFGEGYHLQYQPINRGLKENILVEKYNGVTAEGLVESALDKVRIIEEMGYDNLVISIKSSDVMMCAKAHELITNQTDHPLHVGITEAGTLYSGNIKSAVGLGIILYQGIGDTIRVSLTGDPLEEIKSAKRILKTLGLRKGGIEVVSCPTCGRTQIDLIGLANQVETLVQGYDLDIKVAVMGCVVNGPGEAKEADLGVAGGKGVGILIKKGEIVKKVPESELLSVLKDELDHWGK